MCDKNYKALLLCLFFYIELEHALQILDKGKYKVDKKAVENIIYLKDNLGYSYSEVAEAMYLSKSTVYKHYRDYKEGIYERF